MNLVAHSHTEHILYLFLQCQSEIHLLSTSSNDYCITPDNIRLPLHYSDCNFLFLWLMKLNCWVTIDKMLMILPMGWNLGLGQCGRGWLSVCLICFSFHHDTQLNRIPQAPLQLGVTISRIWASEIWLKVMCITSRSDPQNPPLGSSTLLTSVCWLDVGFKITLENTCWTWQSLHQPGSPWSKLTFLVLPMIDRILYIRLSPLVCRIWIVMSSKSW